jgi:hypothetical protein
MAEPALYQSGWSPSNIRKAWDRCSMTLNSSKHYLGRWAEHRGSPLVECVGWFDDDGSARVIVGEYESGARVIVRLNLRNTKITFQPPPSEVARRLQASVADIEPTNGVG